jgi:hypothetical protein
MASVDSDAAGCAGPLPAVARIFACKGVRAAVPPTARADCLHQPENWAKRGNANTVVVSADECPDVALVKLTAVRRLSPQMRRECRGLQQRRFADYNIESSNVTQVAGVGIMRGSLFGCQKLPSVFLRKAFLVEIAEAPY